MIQIGDTLVSLDLIERHFVCDLAACKGQCCIDGDAGAPLTEAESKALQDALPAFRDEMLPGARRVADEQGASYIDEEGDLVSSIVDGCNCIFTTYGPGGECLCLLEKAWREGRAPMLKPASCRLYPVRVKQYDGFRAVNFHRWKICKPAEVLGRRLGTGAYEFLEPVLTDYFGAEWYAELKVTAEEYLRQKAEGKIN